MKFALIASLPVVALIATFVVFLMIAAKNLCLEAYERYKGRSLSPPTEVDSLYGLCFACFYYLYLQVVKNAMEPLDCLQLADGRSVMQADPAIECVSSNSTYVLLKLWAIVCLAGYGIGIPIMFVIVLFVYRKEIKVDQVR